jgi:hypothetical protein
VDFNKLKESWGSAIVARSEINRFTGGALQPRTLANLDSKGAGPQGKFKIGRKVCYPIEAVIAWIRARSD